MMDQAQAGAFVTAEEMRMKSAWLDEHVLGARPPFSFIYGERHSSDLLASWTRASHTEQLPGGRVEHVLVWTEPVSRLEVRCVAVDYPDFPVIEWTVTLKNSGSENTPILEHIQALEVDFTRSAVGEFALHGNKGDWCVAESYEPYHLALGHSSTKRFAPVGGRPTNGPDGWPYYNLQWPGGGVILAIGWPGQWACSFVRDGSTGLHVRAGQEVTHLTLAPGEGIRTPLIAMLFWQGSDIIRSQNNWRRWMLAHNLPRVDGQLPEPLVIGAAGMGDIGVEKYWEQVAALDEVGLDWQACWIDAGWYPCQGNWVKTGTWTIDTGLYPQGFRPLADWLHRRGKKLIVWFEPERVGDPTSWLAGNHPEWLLGGLLNLGDPAALRWATDLVDDMITTQGIDIYRQDFNMDPLGDWQRGDAPNRQGMSENLHVQGYLAFWDELRRRHPSLWIDSCASGGRRNDLETLRRSLPLRRSDYEGAGDYQGGDRAIPMQGQTYGLSAWVPYYGVFGLASGKFLARSCYSPSYGLWLPQRYEWSSELSAAVRQAFAECSRVAPYMLGDYYPLTPYSLASDTWIAWQFHRPLADDGIVQAFRRAQNEASRLTFRLAGLEPEALYELTNLDGGAAQRCPGAHLMEQGLIVEIANRPGAALVFYRRSAA